MRYRGHACRTPWLKSIVSFSLILLFAWGAGLFTFAAKIPDRVTAAHKQTDAIVVLTGGSGRLRAGLDLLLGERAEHLFISGVYGGVDVRQLLAILKQRPEDIETRSIR